MSRRQLAATAVLAACTVVAVLVDALVWPRFFDSTPPGVGRLRASSCGGAPSRACTTKQLEISPGRYWIEAGAPTANRLEVEFEVVAGSAARALLLPARSDALAVRVRGPNGALVRAAESGGGFRRRVLQLEGVVGGQVVVTLERPPGDAEPLRIEEVGLFASDARLLRDERPFLRMLPDRRVYMGILGRLCLGLAVVGLLAAFGLPSRMAVPMAAAFALAVTLAAASLELWLAHNPYWLRSRDLRVMLASGPLQDGVGGNLNYGMYLGSRLLQGEGITFGPGWVPWERTPGYAFVGALAGLLAGYRTDIFSIGLRLVMLNVLCLAGASAVFVTAASRVIRTAAALAVALVIAFMPSQLADTQADSIMVPVYLLSAAALCRYLDRSRDGAIPPPDRPPAGPQRVRAVVPDATGRPGRLGGGVGPALLAPQALARAAGSSRPRHRRLVGRIQVPVHRRVLDDHEHRGGQRLDRALAGAPQVPLADRRPQLLHLGGREGPPAHVEARIRHHACGRLRASQ